MEDKPTMTDIVKKIVYMYKTGMMREIQAKTTLMGIEAGYFQALNDIEHLLEEDMTEKIKSACEAARKFCLLRSTFVSKGDFDSLLDALKAATDD